MTLRRATAALLALARKPRLEEELEGEVLGHIELAEQDAIAAGLSAEEARHVARRRFGGIEQMKEAHRDHRSFRWIENLLRDFRHGLASLVRDPGFTAVTVGVLALGIGANVAMFSLVDAVLLKPLPFPEPDRIVRVWEAPRPGARNATSTLDFLDWRRLNNAFGAISAERSISAAMTGQGEPARLSGKLVSADYFKVFGASPVLGRTFLPEDDQPGAEPMVVLSHAVWQTHFGGDPDILSRRPVLDGAAHQVIGILPPGPFDRDQAEFWKPLIFTPDQQTRDYHWLTVFGRLREEVTLEQARAEMDSVHAALADVTETSKLDWTIVVESLDRLLVGDNLRQSIIVAFGAVVLVLLIACANVANLLLAKGAARRKEMAVRAALGAGRGRLVAQLLTESSVLCLLGGAAGIAVASFLIQVATPLLPELVPYTSDVSLDLRALAFAAAVALGVAMMVGTLPSLQTSFGRLSQSMNQANRGSSGARAGIRRMIVVGEVALSLMLVCGALLLLRSLLNLQHLETGVRIDNIMTMSAALPEAGYPTPERAALFYDTVVERLEAVPGVEQAAVATHLPLQWIGSGEGVFAPGAEPFNVRFKRVDPGYFGTLDIPVLAGRGISEHDREGTPHVVVINESLAARLADVAGMQNPVGQPIRLSRPAYMAKEGAISNVEIVGIIRSERVSDPGSPDPPVAYVPLAQVPWPYVRIIVRTQADPASIMPSVREAVREIDPNLPLGDIATMQQVRDRTLVGASRPAWLLGAFAAVAALLVALGLYGVLAHAVTEQRREIGIRVALGARPGDVFSHVLGGAARMIVAGLVLGLAGALALTRVLESLLFQVSALDPVALVIACVAMALVGLLAGFVPASRAARIDPIAVLRDEG